MWLLHVFELFICTICHHYLLHLLFLYIQHVKYFRTRKKLPLSTRIIHLFTNTNFRAIYDYFLYILYLRYTYNERANNSMSLVGGFCVHVQFSKPISISFCTHYNTKDIPKRLILASEDLRAAGLDKRHKL